MGITVITKSGHTTIKHTRLLSPRPAQAVAASEQLLLLLLHVAALCLRAQAVAFQQQGPSGMMDLCWHAPLHLRIASVVYLVLC